MIESRMVRTANLEEKLKALQEVMGDEYDTSYDTIQPKTAGEEEEEAEALKIKAKIELISTQTIQQYEQQATKLMWLKKKLEKIRARGDHRRQQDLERLAEIEAREEEEEHAASEVVQREDNEPSAVSPFPPFPPLTLPLPIGFPAPDSSNVLSTVRKNACGTRVSRPSTDPPVGCRFSQQRRRAFSIRARKTTSRGRDTRKLV